MTRIIAAVQRSRERPRVLVLIWVISDTQTK